MTVHSNEAEPWRVTLADTGLNSQTGARLKKIQKYIGNKTFMMTYGDGVGNIDLNRLLQHHRETGMTVTLTGVQPGGRYGVLDLDKNGIAVSGFREKAQEDGGWINAGFMVMEPRSFDYLNAQDDCIFEKEPLERLAFENKLGVYKHYGFWKCMDTQRDKVVLEDLWNSEEVPWKIWGS